MVTVSLALVKEWGGERGGGKRRTGRGVEGRAHRGDPVYERPVGVNGEEEGAFPRP